MKSVIRLSAALVIAILAIVEGEAQTNTIQLRNGANSTTILPSASTTISVQIPALTGGTHYLLTSTTNPGSSGAAGSFLTYGATSAQNTFDISATGYLFNVGYAATAVEQHALGGSITSTATGTNKSATALSLAATKTGTGTATALYITNGSLTFTDSDDSHITSFTTGDQAVDINYTLPTTAGTNGQALITNGSGTLSWGAAGATNLDGLSDAKVEGTDFTGSMILGHQATGTLSAATYNTAVGIGAMDEITGGDYNTALGSSALTKLTTGAYNIAVGSDALVMVNTGSYNVSLGASAGRQITTGTYNVSIGHQSGNGITTGSDNISIGFGAFYFTTTGSNNVGVGRYTMNAGPSGSNNVAVGSDALRSATAVESNVAIGTYAGRSVTTGDFNTLLGHRAGDSLTTGSSNVFIGYLVGTDGTIDTESNLLMIDNSATLTPLIYGDFSANTLTFNGATTTTGTSAINGVVSIGGTTTAAGEIRLLEDLDDGSHYTAFKAQAQAANVTYTLPAADGTSGQVLSTDGSGTLTWATATAVAAINDLTDAVKDITNFSNSMILGHQLTGTLSSASNNTAVGMAAMDAITQGDDNTVLGYNAATALTTGSQNVTIGSGAGSGLTTGSRNILIGYSAGSALTTEDDKLYIDPTNTATPLVQGDFSANTLTFNGATTTTGNVTVQGTAIYSPPGSAKAITATTSTGAGAPDIAAFTNTYDKVAVTATTAAGYVQLPAGTDGQVLYLRLAFTADASNSTVTVVNSNNTNTAMVYDGTGADVIVAHMLYTTGEGWVVFSALEYDN